MENHHAIKNGKPSISMGHLYHGYVSHNQRVLIPGNHQTEEWFGISATLAGGVFWFQSLEPMVPRDTRPGKQPHNELENHHLVRELSHEKWWFPIVM